MILRGYKYKVKNLSEYIHFTNSITEDCEALNVDNGSSKYRYNMPSEYCTSCLLLRR